MKYVLLICYDGTDFSGWQKQKNARTVQETLESAAEQVFQQKVKITGSGRTDAGVHAMGQVAEFEVETSVPAHKLRECLNGVLPSDVRVLESAAAPQDFDITRSARQKTYEYRAYFAPCEIPLMNRYAARLISKPDVTKMQNAAKLLLGEHDFAAFRAAGYTSKTSVRTLYAVEISEAEGEGYTQYVISVTGNGFLYNMVRILAGELFAIGCGKEEGITAAFETGARNALAKTMPPQGLILKKVEYGAPLFGAKE